MRCPVNCNILNVNAAIQFVAYDDDPLARLAERILVRHSQTLPDLSAHIVLFPEAAAIPRFRQVLLQAAARQGVNALLPPATATLAGWLRTFHDPTLPMLNQNQRELRLLAALQSQPQILNQGNPWALVDSLLQLFDLLSENQGLANHALAQFKQLLHQGYGTGTKDLLPLSDEAYLVHSLWRAWRQDLATSHCQDQALAKIDALSRSQRYISGETHLYLAGFSFFDRGEIAWIQSLQKQSRLTLMLHGQTGGAGYHPDSALTDLVATLGAPMPAPERTGAYGRFLDEVYALNGPDLLARATRLAQAQPHSPIRPTAASTASDNAENSAHNDHQDLAVFTAKDAEQEAQAIALQLRRWWQKGLRDIGIITNDRKLARRVRALLERAAISLQDAAGWPLSTTSAASALMCWLDVIELNFTQASFMELLKSPFAFDGQPLALRKLAVCHFEREILAHAEQPRGLKAYHHALARYRAKLAAKSAADYADKVAPLLDEVAQAASVLLPLCDGHQHAAHAYLTALGASLDSLDMTLYFTADGAGQLLLAELAQMQDAAGALTLSWSEFRAWLTHAFERQRFRPPMRGRGIELMSFSESRLYRFQALIIAGATETTLPGAARYTPFFNDAVRRQLGLRTVSAQQAELFYDFRRLLAAAGEIVVTLRAEDAGEPVSPSPWLARLCAFHQAAYGDGLAATGLKNMISAIRQKIQSECDYFHYPSYHKHPSIIVDSRLIPVAISASSHQSLLNCPYQYYATYCLKINRREELRLEMRKADYGQRVHHILQAFHSGYAGLPGPFTPPLCAATYAQAEDLLNAITQRVFSQDLDSSFFASGWLYRWQNTIPAYLSWQMARARVWLPIATEYAQTRALSGTDVTLNGRIDRLDQKGTEWSIIDYKTGVTPDVSEVLAGEQIQLPFYRLLLDKTVTEALFLALDGGVKEVARLDGVALSQLSQATQERLQELQQALHQGQALTAWGDEKTCRHCAMDGLCRKEMWHE